MRAFFDARMALAVADGSTPSHAKPVQLFEFLHTSVLPIDWQPVVPVEWEDLETIHDPKYLQVVRTGEPRELLAEASVEWTPELAESLRWTVGGMAGAALSAAEHGCAASLSSGFHHAHYAKPGTFCLVNGLVLAASRFLETMDAGPVLILDCDFHAGNGTDDILGRLIEGLGAGIRHVSFGRKYRRPDQAVEYLREIARVGKRIERSDYRAVVYQAGMDVLRGDPLGGLLTYREAFERDLRVFEACRRGNTPVAWNLAGGYRRDADGGIMPVLRGHLNTFIACTRVFDGFEDLQPEWG